MKKVNFLENIKKAHSVIMSRALLITIRRNARPKQKIGALIIGMATEAMATAAIIMMGGGVRLRKISSNIMV